MTYLIISLVGLVVVSPALLVVRLTINDRRIVVIAALAFAAFMGALLAFAGSL